MKKLILILIFAAILRLWHIGSVPPSLSQDEAALGYNAYSVLKTGRDEYGKILPVIFKSFGDYKPGLYIYLDVPFVATLGLNEVSTRLPSALAGILSVYLIYLIVKNLFNSLGIVAAFIAASNPWLIYFSRGAWEANVSLMFTLAGIYFFLKALKKHWFLLASSLFFALTLITYQGAKLSTAIVVLTLVVVHWKDIIKVGKKYIFSSLILGLTISLPIVISLFNGQSGRLDVFSIFSYPRPKDYVQNFLDEGGEKIGDVNYYLFHSESLNLIRGVLGRYFNNFSSKFLFFEGDYQNPQHSAPYQGMLLLGDILLLPLGLFAILKSKILNCPSIIFVFLWLILSPLPAVLSRDQVQSVRALNMAVPLVIVLAFGLEEIFNFVRKQKYTIPFYVLVAVLYSAGTIYFADAYFVHLPIHDAKYWNYGYKQIVDFVSPIQGKYKTIKIQQSFAQPYIYFLYYQKYNPLEYQRQAKLVTGANPSDVGLVTKLGNIEFAQINWSVDQNGENMLLIADPVTLPEDKGLIQEIKYLDGREVAFKIIETK